MLHCKTGIRSAEALATCRKAGFADAVHLQGGVVAWASSSIRHSRLLSRVVEYVPERPRPIRPVSGGSLRAVALRNGRRITSVRPSVVRGLQPVALGAVGRAAGGGRRRATPVADHARAAWSAKVRETPGRRRGPARPAGARHGWPLRRSRLAGGHLRRGTPEPRHDEVVSLSLRLHAATAQLERPRFLAQPPVAPWADVDVFVAADRAAWEERSAAVAAAGARVSPGVGRRSALRRADRAARSDCASRYRVPRSAGARRPVTAPCFSRAPPRRASPTSRRTGVPRRGRPGWW